MTTNAKDNSKLVQRIKRVLEDVSDSNVVLHVSVAKKPIWEELGCGEMVHVRWICWSVEDCEGNELHPPEFDVLSPMVTKERLAEELPDVFDGVKVVVDDDIEV